VMPDLEGSKARMDRRFQVIPVCIVCEKVGLAHWPRTSESTPGCYIFENQLTP